MQSVHLFQRIERSLRMHPDAQRWRVTMQSDTIEIFRRPVLTNEVTLGALGLTNAPMPVPICVIIVHVLPDAMARVRACRTSAETIVPIHQAQAAVLSIVAGWGTHD